MSITASTGTPRASSTASTAGTQDAVRAASAVLTRVLRQENWFVLSSDRALAEEGYLCWTPGLTLAAGRSSAALYDSVKRYADGRTEPGRVLLDTKLPASLIGGLVDRLTTAGDTFLRPRETRIGIALFFIASRCSPRITSIQPVVVTKMSPRGAASSIVVTS